MNLYENPEYAKKFFPLITLSDLSEIEQDHTIYADPTVLCKNEFWVKFLFPEKSGFAEEKNYEFGYDSNFFSLKHLLKCFDIMHGKGHRTDTLEEEISIAKFLKEYSTEETFKRFAKTRLLNEDLDTQTTDINEEYIRKNVDPIRWKEFGIIDYLAFSKHDNYITYKCEVIEYDDDGEPLNPRKGYIKINERLVDNYVDMGRILRWTFDNDVNPHTVIHNMKEMIDIFESGEISEFCEISTENFVDKYMTEEGRKVFKKTILVDDEDDE